MRRKEVDIGSLRKEVDIGSLTMWFLSHMVTWPFGNSLSVLPGFQRDLPLPIHNTVSVRSLVKTGALYSPHLHLDQPSKPLNLQSLPKHQVLPFSVGAGRRGKT